MTVTVVGPATKTVFILLRIVTATLAGFRPRPCRRDLLCSEWSVDKPRRRALKACLCLSGPQSVSNTCSREGTSHNGSGQRQAGSSVSGHVSSEPSAHGALWARQGRDTMVGQARCLRKGTPHLRPCIALAVRGRRRFTSSSCSRKRVSRKAFGALLQSQAWPGDLISRLVCTASYDHDMRKCGKDLKQLLRRPSRRRA